MRYGNSRQVRLFFKPARFHLYLFDETWIGQYQQPPIWNCLSRLNILSLVTLYLCPFRSLNFYFIIVLVVVNGTGSSEAARPSFDCGYSAANAIPG
jgi:hypothetical protein